MLFESESDNSVIGKFRPVLKTGIYTQAKHIGFAQHKAQLHN
jgi:hypothetical protein